AMLLREPDVGVVHVAIEPRPVDLSLALLGHSSSLQYADASIRYRDPAPHAGPAPRTAGRRPSSPPRRHDRGGRSFPGGAGGGRPGTDRTRAHQVAGVRGGPAAPAADPRDPLRRTRLPAGPGNRQATRRLSQAAAEGPARARAQEARGDRRNRRAPPQGAPARSAE